MGTGSAMVGGDGDAAASGVGGGGRLLASRRCRRRRGVGVLASGDGVGLVDGLEVGDRLALFVVQVRGDTLMARRAASCWMTCLSIIVVQRLIGQTALLLIDVLRDAARWLRRPVVLAWASSDRTDGRTSSSSCAAVMLSGPIWATTSLARTTLS